MKIWKLAVRIIISLTLLSPASYANSNGSPQSKPAILNDIELEYTGTIVTSYEELEFVVNRTIHESETSEAPTELLFAHTEPLPLDYDDVEKVDLPTNSWQGFKAKLSDTAQRINERINLRDLRKAQENKPSFKDKTKAFLKKLQKSPWKYNLFFGGVRGVGVGGVMFTGFMIAGLPTEASAAGAAWLGTLSGLIQGTANFIYSPLLMSTKWNPFSSLTAAGIAPFTDSTYTEIKDILKEHKAFSTPFGLLKFYLTEYLILASAAVVFWIAQEPQYASWKASLIPLAVSSWYAFLGQAPGDQAFADERDQKIKSILKNKNLTDTEKAEALMDADLSNVAKLFGFALFANFFVGIGLFDGEAQELGQDLLKLLSVVGFGYLAYVLSKNTKTYKTAKEKIKKGCSQFFENAVPTQATGQLVN